MKNAALASELLAALLETSSVSDHAAGNFADLMRCTDLTSEQALTVERVFKALRAQFEAFTKELKALPVSPEQAVHLDAVVSELRGKLGIAAGALRRWNLGAQSCAETARLASTAMTSVRTRIAEASHAAEDLLID